MSGEGSESRVLGWAGRLAVLIACAAGALSGWFGAVGVAALLDEALGALPATAIGVLVFFPAAILGFALGLTLMSLLLALVLRTLPNGNGRTSGSEA